MVAGLFLIVSLRSGATYLLGRLASNAAHHTRVRKLMDSPRYQVAAARLNRWGAPAVSMSFLTIGVQTLVNLAAGAIRMPLRRYLPALLVGCLAWALLYATFGFVGVEAIVRLYEINPALAVIALVCAVAAIGGYVAWQFQRRTSDASVADEPTVTTPQGH